MYDFIASALLVSYIEQEVNPIHQTDLDRQLLDNLFPLIGFYLL